MQFAGRQLFFKCLVDMLLALDAVFTGEFGAHDDSLEMLAIAIKGKVLAGHAGENEFFDFIRVHHGFRLLISSPA